MNGSSWYDPIVPNSCSPYDESLIYLPHDPITISQKQQGAILLHILYFIYLLIGLSLITHDYLRPLLIHISIHVTPIDNMTRPNMSYIISVPIMILMTFSILTANHDVGIGLVIGSIMIDTTLQYALLAFFIVPVMTLSWWRITRDTISICITLWLLACITADGILHWWEGLILLIWSVIYGIGLMYNVTIWNYIRMWKVRDMLYEAQTNKLARFISSFWFRFCMGILVSLHVLFVVWQLSQPQSWHLSITKFLSWVYVIELFLTSWSMGTAAYWSHPYHAYNGMIVCIILYEFMFGVKHVVGALRIITVVLSCCMTTRTSHQTLHDTDPVIFPSLELSELPSSQHQQQHEHEQEHSHSHSHSQNKHDTSSSVVNITQVNVASSSSSHDDMTGHIPSLPHRSSVSGSFDASHRLLPHSPHSYHKVQLQSDEHDHVHEDGLDSHDDGMGIGVSRATVQPITQTAINHAQTHDIPISMPSTADQSRIATPRDHEPILTSPHHGLDESDVIRWSIVPPQYHAWRIPVAIVTVIVLSCLCIAVMAINIKTALQDASTPVTAIVNNGTATTIPPTTQPPNSTLAPTTPP